VNHEALRARQTVIASTYDRASSVAGGLEALAAKEAAALKTVRESSVTGPCVTLGLALGETGRRISYRDRHGTTRFVSKRWAVHIEPCPACSDHPKTKYPDWA
jgi:hypothetical protein